MTNFDQQKRRTVYSDGPNLDAFGRLRISGPYRLASTANEYDQSPLFWDFISTGAASSNHVTGAAAIRLRVGGTVGDRALRSTRRYIRYQPGKSQQVLLTGTLGASQAGVDARLGYYDDNDGVFFESGSAGVAVVLRSSACGVISETRVLRANWNVDKMDGSGPSGSMGVLDTSKSNIYLFDMEWLGVGRVRCGLNMDGRTWHCHEFNNSNRNEGVYMRTANLPMRYEIVNTGTTGSAASMLQICSVVNSEGGVQDAHISFAAGNNSTLRTVSNALFPVASIRVASAFPTGQTAAASQVNRMTVIPLHIDLFSEDAPIYYRVVRNASLTTPVWTAVNASYSGVEFDVSASSASGGLVIENGYLPVGRATAGGGVSELNTTLWMSTNACGTAGDTLTLLAERVGNTNTDVGVGFNWKELY